MQIFEIRYWKLNHLSDISRLYGHCFIRNNSMHQVRSSQACMPATFRCAVAKLNEGFIMLVPNMVSDQLYVYQCINRAVKYVEPKISVVSLAICAPRAHTTNIRPW